jgi:hypothetical protein
LLVHPGFTCFRQTVMLLVQRDKPDKLSDSGHAVVIRKDAG